MQERIRLYFVRLKCLKYSWVYPRSIVNWNSVSRGAIADAFDWRDFNEVAHQHIS